MKNILITGGAGFIGCNFIKFLLDMDQGVKVVNFDLLSYAGNKNNLLEVEQKKGYHFIHGDICDWKLVEKTLKEHEIDTVVHFAAETHVDRSIEGPKQFIQTNINGTFVLLEETRKYWLEEGISNHKQVRFHHISTDEVFGSLGPEDDAFSDETAYDPRSPYSASKASSDHLVRSYFHTYGLPISISNCSNNYGPNQHPEKLIPLIINNAIRNIKLPVYGDGKQIRDWLYVTDHCKAIYQIITKGKPGETYLVGGNNQPSNMDIIMMVCNLLDSLAPNEKIGQYSSLITHIEDRPGHDRRYAMNINSIRIELGWEPEESLESGLKKTVEWYLSHQNWVESIIGNMNFRSWMTRNYGERGRRP